jgi:hypothetical protein
MPISTLFKCVLMQLPGHLRANWGGGDQLPYNGHVGRRALKLDEQGSTACSKFFGACSVSTSGTARE